MLPKGEVVSTCRFRSICMYHILADVFSAMNIFVTIPSMPGLRYFWYFSVFYNDIKINGNFPYLCMCI
jgi:hypothetical protein